MKIDFSKTLKDLEGRVLKEPTSGSKELKAITLKDLCANALVNNTEGDADNKIKKYELALKIAASTTKPIDIVSDDVVLIKSCISKFPPLYYGQAVHLLEGK